MSSRRSFVRVVRESAESVRRYRERLDEHLRVIKAVARERFGPDAKVYLFGSVLRGDYGPLSDIDVAVVLKSRPALGERAEFRSRLREELGLFHPFEVHVVSEGDWEGWYRRFVKRYREV